ncbi:hypothetical protein [Halomicronema sp. CCY15110]|uniref:hypothetical protein n=1 Tax=Halomicronema sp. CCY15110 TaxID=2767773 RepID=UPI001950CAAD|nr:hypothetical protein [Halomicronema sp. CCY15110]
MNYQSAARAVLSRDKFQTPRWVWVNSAIAAALLHSLVAWWGLVAWQQRRVAVPSPAPIKLVTLSPTPTAPALATTTAIDEPTTNQSVNDAASNAARQSANPAPTPATTTPVATNSATVTGDRAPVHPQSTPTTPPSSSSVTPTAPVTPPAVPTVPSPPPAVTPPPSSSVSPPSAAPTPIPVNPTPPSGATPNPVIPPTRPPSDAGSENGENGDAPPALEAPTDASASGLQSWWSLQPVPGGGSDIHDEPPQLPPGWQAEAAAIFQGAGCAAGLIPAGAAVRVTVRPTIDAQGQIMQLLPWEGNANVPAAVLQCVETLAPRLPSFIPARDGGVAIASDAVVLVIELRGAP